MRPANGGPHALSGPQTVRGANYRQGTLSERPTCYACYICYKFHPTARASAVRHMQRLKHFPASSKGAARLAVGQQKPTERATMFCFHCGEPITSQDGFAEVHRHEATAICLDCAELYEACIDCGCFDGEGADENAFFVDPYGRIVQETN